MQRLFVAVPDFFFQKRPAEGPAREPPEDERERIIEPDDRVGPGPDNIAHDTVIAVSGPALTYQQPVCALTKDLVRLLSPVRAPVQLVELDMWHAKPGGEAPGHGSLA